MHASATHMDTFLCCARHGKRREELGALTHEDARHDGEANPAKDLRRRHPPPAPSIKNHQSKLSIKTSNNPPRNGQHTSRHIRGQWGAPAPCTLHPAPCTLHPAPCTLHPAPCTLHPAPCSPAHSPRLCSWGRTLGRTEGQWVHCGPLNPPWVACFAAARAPPGSLAQTRS